MRTLDQFVRKLFGKPEKIIGKTYYRLPRWELDRLKATVGEPDSIISPYPDVMIVRYKVDGGWADITGDFSTENVLDKGWVELAREPAD